jgi:hypothetical protein
MLLAGAPLAFFMWRRLAQLGGAPHQLAPKGKSCGALSAPLAFPTGADWRNRRIMARLMRGFLRRIYTFMRARMRASVSMRRSPSHAFADGADGRPLHDRAAVVTGGLFGAASATRLRQAIKLQLKTVV